jgi:membrane associated rhomboid family serine protease
MVEVNLHETHVLPIPIVRRFITAIFLHAGFIHIALNMMVQLTAAAQVSAVAQTRRIIHRPCLLD